MADPTRCRDPSSTFWRDIDPENLGLGLRPREPSPDHVLQIGCTDEDYERLARGEHVRVVMRLNDAMVVAVVRRPWKQMTLAIEGAR